MLVTVLMSVYNSDKYLDDAINSILNQTYKDFEFLIIDDGSTDRTEAIINKYMLLDSRIVFIKNDHNIGLASSLNKGINLAKGKYIARQDADDLSAHDRLEKQIQFALLNEDIDLVGSNCYIIDINGEVVYENNTYSKRKDIYKNLLNCKAIFPHGCVLVKKDILLKAGLYDSRFYYSQDGELWLRLIENEAKFHTMEDPLYYYRSAPRSSDKKYQAQCMYNKVKKMIYSGNADQEAVNNELAIIKTHISSNLQFPRPYYMAEYWKGLANGAYLNNGKLLVSYKYLIKALKEKNLLKKYPVYISLFLIYLFPSSLVKNLFRIDQGTAEG